MTIERYMLDRLRRLREANQHDNFTYKEYLELSNSQDSKQNYIQFLIQAKGVDPKEAEEQANYNYSQNESISDPYKLSPKEKLKADVIEKFEELVYDRESIPNIEIKWPSLFFDIQGYRFEMRISTTAHGMLFLTDPENYDGQYDEEIPEIEEILDDIFYELEKVVDGAKIYERYLAEEDNVDSRDSRLDILTDFISKILRITPRVEIQGDEVYSKLYGIEPDVLENLHRDLVGYYRDLGYYEVFEKVYTSTGSQPAIMKVTQLQNEGIAALNIRTRRNSVPNLVIIGSGIAKDLQRDLWTLRGDDQEVDGAI